jgi:hypothetical protein
MVLIADSYALTPCVARTRKGVALMWSDLAALMNIPTRVGIGAYFAISFVFDIWSGHLSFLRDLVIVITVVFVIRVFLALTKPRNSN